MKNSINYTNSDDYVFTVESTNTYMLDLRLDCAVYFIQQSIAAMSSIIKAAQ